MAYIVGFTATKMSTEQYDECIKRLEEAGAGAPAGRLYHVCFGDAGNLQVTDVWDSMENFEKFGQTLMPILQELEIDPGQPQVIKVHHIIEG